MVVKECMTLTLKQGDALHHLRYVKADSVDLVIADPPYQSEAGPCNLRTMGRRGFEFDFDEGFDQRKWLQRIHRPMKTSGNIVVFNAWQRLGDVDKSLKMEGFDVKDHLVWIKANPRRANQKRRFLADKENMVWGVKKPSKGWVFLGDGMSSIFYHPVANKPKSHRHPCEKPLGLMLDLIELLSRPGDTVLDPFMGHGVVGQACQQLGRKFIGFEKDPGYFAEAANRLLKVNV